MGEEWYFVSDTVSFHYNCISRSWKSVHGCFRIGGHSGVREQETSEGNWKCRSQSAPDNVLSILLVAELLYSLQWYEELDNPPIFLTGFCEMLQKMNITYDNLRGLGNTSGLLQLLFDRWEPLFNFYFMSILLVYGFVCVKCKPTSC